ncbi:division/cell wall cluster transcriptional repressor MraZ [Terrimonas rubra]|uniref:Transcriptional regulator MraZ n=1 Tax=Terrimonas rubra TaxID=1035890 RepID=A0ABW6A501_9BACT
MITLRGEYAVTLDAKGRFLLPAGLKKQVEEAGGLRFVINKGFEQCLNFYPEVNWLPVEAKVNALNDFKLEVRQFKRLFMNGVTDVEPDSAGRILIPGSLKEFAGLNKDIVLTTAGNKFEIWDSNKYKEFFESPVANSYGDLAEKLLGGPSSDEIIL